MFSYIFPKNLSVYEIVWKNIVEPDVTQMIIWRIMFAPKATNTHSEYVIFIAFPLRQMLRECASVLRLYVCITLSVLCITERKRVYCAVRTEYLNVI
jgi:hypothetical protein